MIELFMNCREFICFSTSIFAGGGFYAGLAGIFDLRVVSLSFVTRAIVIARFVRLTRLAFLPFVSEAFSPLAFPLGTGFSSLESSVVVSCAGN